MTSYVYRKTYRIFFFYASDVVSTSIVCTEMNMYSHFNHPYFDTRSVISANALAVAPPQHLPACARKEQIHGTVCAPSKQCYILELSVRNCYNC